MRIVSALIAVWLVAVGSPLHAQEWSEWQVISPNDSYIGLSVPEGISLPEIERVRSQELQYQAKQELWSWESGGIHAFILDDLRYMQRRGKKDLIASIDSWKFLTDIGLTATTRDVERSKNKMGNYYYIVGGSADGELTCFLFLQNLRAANPGGYEQAAGTVAAGFVSGFDCQDSTSTTLLDHEKLMKTYMSSMHRQ